MATEPLNPPQPAQGGAIAETELDSAVISATAGASPWALAWRRLRRNKVSLAFGVLFVLLVCSALAAPLWAEHVANTTPSKNNISEVITVDGEERQVVDFDGVPVGPTWQKKYF